MSDPPPTKPVFISSINVFFQSWFIYLFLLMRLNNRLGLQNLRKHCNILPFPYSLPHYNLKHQFVSKKQNQDKTSLNIEFKKHGRK